MRWFCSQPTQRSVQVEQGRAALPDAESEVATRIDMHLRPHGTPEIFTLDDYRNRYALYKTDPALPLRATISDS